eukprot:CAMPEP_0183588294 /NCGR_PEP_ID=MMETSP0371-20130417/160544_1 /TAXON_ID=268820 /ORGANISM="Peridinium aciculiferum, Strain PAER-2" /LENGTH=140 /DNA_ID=CAMNT_0025799547 /DNA_START=49 /DNA_END=468 /DNA_ORIENTATION=+
MWCIQHKLPSAMRWSRGPGHARAGGMYGELRPRSPRLAQRIRRWRGGAFRSMLQEVVLHVGGARELELGRLVQPPEVRAEVAEDAAKCIHVLVHRGVQVPGRERFYEGPGEGALDATLYRQLGTPLRRAAGRVAMTTALR